MASVAWSTAQWRVIADPHPAGYRGAYWFTCIPDYAKAVALAELLGIHAPVLYLRHIAVEGPLYNVSRDTDTSNRSWKKPLSTHMPQVIADLRALGWTYAAQADAVEAMSLGRTPYDTEGTWLSPVNKLLEAEKQRLN
ncbi:hypothetical protein [Streptomyces chartreusis]